MPCLLARSFLAAALLELAVLGALGAAAAAPAAPSADPATERVRAVLRDHGGLGTWGADRPEEDFTGRGEPVAAAVLRGGGHAFIAVDSNGKPLGETLDLLHVSIDGATASATECVLRQGPDGDRSCPPLPSSLVDCSTWSVPVEAARAALRQARAALFVRIYEKQFLGGPREEQEDDENGVEGGVVGGVEGGTTNDFSAVVSVLEVGRHRIRVSGEWTGYASGRESGQYARAVAAADFVEAAFPRPETARATAPPAVMNNELSRLLATLPLDAEYWWWVRERLVLMAGGLGTPADLPKLEGYLAPRSAGPSELRTRAYALESLARRTGRDTRCDGTRRLDDAAAAAAWKHPRH